MRPYTVLVRRSAKRSFSGLAAALVFGLSACVPAVMEPPVTGVPAAPSGEPNVRVGIAVDTATVQISSATPMELVDGVTNRTLSTVPAGRNVVITAEGADRIRARVDGADIWTSGTLLLARPQQQGTLTIAGRNYRGTALIRVAGPGRITAINQVDMEAYLLGVVPREIGRVGEELLEAAKAQAVAARTYAVRYMGRREALGFDVFATIQDQVYGGIQDEHDPVSRAVRETAGEVMLYRGEPIEAFYHSTCAGQTAAIEEVWNEAPRPYLRSVVDRDPRTGEAFDRSSNRFTWTQRWTAQEITGILNRTLADSLPAGVSTIGEIQNMQVLERTPSDRVRRMRITTSNGTFHVGGDRIRWILLTPAGVSLNSSKFDVELVRGPAGRVQEVVATGGGWGHGIGMCQVGAMGRARAGQDYRTILTTYYSDVEIRRLY
jgi:stage II sporulation protein D